MMNGGEGEEPAASLPIAGLEPLRVVSDPLRMRLVELLRQGPATVKALAAATGVAPRSLYYHVNLLERHGLIRVVHTRVVSGILEKTYRATAHVFEFSNLTPPEGGEVAAGVGALFRGTLEEFLGSLRAERLGPGGMSGDQPGYDLSWELLTLSAVDAAEFARRFDALLEEFQTRAAGTAPDRPVETYRVLFTAFRTYFRGGRTTPQ